MQEAKDKKAIESDRRESMAKNDESKKKQEEKEKEKLKAIKDQKEKVEIQENE